MYSEAGLRVATVHLWPAAAEIIEEVISFTAQAISSEGELGCKGTKAICRRTASDSLVYVKIAKFPYAFGYSVQKSDLVSKSKIAIISRSRRRKAKRS